MSDHKPTIETILNTAALALTSYGVVILTTNGAGCGAGWESCMRGLIIISFGAGLEFFKYWGRKQKYWK